MSSIRTPHLDRFYQATTSHTNWTKHARYLRGASQHANGIFNGDVQLQLSPAAYLTCMITTLVQYIFPALQSKESRNEKTRSDKSWEEPSELIRIHWTWNPKVKEYLSCTSSQPLLRIVDRMTRTRKILLHCASRFKNSSYTNAQLVTIGVKKVRLTYKQVSRLKYIFSSLIATHIFQSQL